MLYGGDSSNAAVVVPCLSRQCALRVYAALASNAGRMGYPAKVVPADLVVQSERFVNDAAKESFMLKQAEAASMAGNNDLVLSCPVLSAMMTIHSLQRFTPIQSNPPTTNHPVT